MVEGNDLKKKGLPLTIIHFVKVILAPSRDENANLFPFPQQPGNLN